MRIFKSIWIAALLLCFTVVKAQETNRSAEEALIRATIMNYIEGTANGEPDKLKKTFHPDFNLYTVDDDNRMLARSGEKYISNVQEGKKANRLGRIISVDHEGNAATAKAEIIVPGWRVFTDYFLLLKYEGSWKIVQKSYTWRDYLDADQPTDQNRSVDSLFSEFDRADHPAVAALVIHKGEVIYKKAMGSAQLDNQIPATTSTKFQLGGMSKHFTAFATLLLEEKGKLSLTDDIRNHLSYLPEYEHTITINHLLTLSSGLPDFWTLKNIAGWHRDDVLTQAHVREIVSKLTPAFTPGDDYTYSNTDHWLLAEIIAKISGQSFPEFMKQEVFNPLEMENTLVVDDFEQYIPNAAASYEPVRNGGFKRSALNYGINGPTNVYASIDDLLKWEMNLLEPKIGSTKLVNKLYEACLLNNGNTMDPAFGRITYGQQLIHKERGVPKAYQTGTLGGYSSSIFKFMEDEFTVIVLSSGIPYNGYLGMQSAYLFIEDQFTEPARTNFAELKTLKLSEKQLKKYESIYWNERSGYSREIAVENDTLRYVRTDGRASSLLPVEKDKFQMMIGGDEKIFVSFSDNKEAKTMAFTQGEASPIQFESITPISASANELNNLVGIYYCESLNTVYELSVENNKLVASNMKAGKVIFNPILEGVFESNSWFFPRIQFKEDKSGFHLNSEEVRYLFFRRLDTIN
ncbi:MAG: serine hydrolase [Cyclobacteriaceae bacterium]